MYILIFIFEILNSSLGGSGLNQMPSNMGGRDFDSLSAALSGNASFSGGNNPPPLGDRRTGGGSSSNRPNSDTIVIKNVNILFIYSFKKTNEELVLPIETSSSIKYSFDSFIYECQF